LGRMAMSKCKSCGFRMLKGYLKIDEETTSKIWVCPRSDDLHLELRESELFFYCTGTSKSERAKRQIRPDLSDENSDF